MKFGFFALDDFNRSLSFLLLHKEMSAFDRIKSHLRLKNHGSQHDVQMHYGDEEKKTVVLPPKLKRRKKMLEVQTESKQSLNHIQSRQGGQKPDRGFDGRMEIDDDDMNVSDEEEEKKSPKKVPWGPSDILNHLDNPERVDDVNHVISQLKKTEVWNDGEDEDGRRKKHHSSPDIIVWDHSQTKEGDQSDRNFFYWLEAYAANQTKKIMEKENEMFE